MSNCRFENPLLISDGPKTHQTLIIGQENIKNVETPYEEKKELKSEVNSEIKHFEFFLKVDTVSEANGQLSKTRFYKNGKPKPEHWTEKSRRHRIQKEIVFLTLNPHRTKIKLPCIVKMIRCASHFLDEDDNLRISVKWIKDAIASVLTQDFVPGRADSDPRIKWQYGQEKSKEKGVKISFYF